MKVISIINTGVVLLFLAAGGMTAALAQTPSTGMIAGTVTDQSGAVVPGATIAITDRATGGTRTVDSDAAGNYNARLLSPGTYSVKIEKAGFRTVQVDDVVVRVTESTIVNGVLQVGALASEVVTVTSEAPLVKTTSATKGEVIDETEIRQLPLPTRNFQQLLTLSPGAVAGLSNNTELGRGDVNISVNGQRTTSNNVIVNGVEVNSPGTNSTPNLSVPAPDAIQEFIVQTSQYDASAGRNSGGNVAAVTKSGTNDFHGNAFEFLRNRVLNANDFFLNGQGRPRPILTRNQFGGTLGGPIVRNKVFFFVSYQGTRERNGASLTNSLTFPNMPAGLTDDRSTTALTSLANAYGLPAVHPVSLSLLQAKLPNGQYAIPSAGAKAALPATLVPTPLSAVSRFREDQFTTNVDYDLTSRNRVAGRFFFSNAPQYQALFSFVGSNPFQLPGYGGNITFHNRVLSLSDTHVFSARAVNQIRFGYSRIYGPSSPEEPFTNAQFGIRNPLASRFPGLATIQVLGLFSLGSTALADQKSVTQTYTVTDNFSYNFGRHSVTMGAEVRHYMVDFFFNFFSRGQINFNSFLDFLSGTTAFGLLGNGVPDRGMRVWDINAFVQEDLRLTNQLTLNMGFRFENNGGITEIRGRLSQFDRGVFFKSKLPCTVGSPCQPPNGLSILSKDESLNPDAFNFAPRFGFAYSPFKQRKAVIRGGFGVYFDRFSTRIANLQIFNYPLDIAGLALGGPYFSNPFPDLSGVSFPINPVVIPSPVPLYIAGIPLPAFPTPISGVYVDPNFTAPYSYSYSLGTQWEPVKGWVVEANYVGTKGTKLINVYTLNQGAGPTAPYTASGFSNNKVLNGFQSAETTASSYYDSLQASLRGRLKALQLLGSYTFSKSIDDASGAPTNELAALPGDQQNRKSQRGLSDFDRTHRLVANFVYDLAKLYSGSSRLADGLANHWQFSGIVTLQSGTPFSVISTSGSATFNRADLLRTDMGKKTGSVKDRLNAYFDPAAYAATFIATTPFGTSGRNILRGPGQANVDFSIIKMIPVSEKNQFEFRAEFFNMFNTVNFANPNNNATVPGTLARITATSTGPRVVQFALKYSF